MEAQDNIVEQFREATRKTETEAFPAMDKVWSRVEQELDKDKKKERKIIPFRKISMAAAVLFFLGLGIFYFLRTSRTSDNKTLVQQKENVQPVKQTVNKGEPILINAGKEKKNVEAVSSNAAVIVRAKKNTHESRLDNLVMKTVKGKVVDENGEGIPGATIKIRGKQDGTVTDIDGNYEIEISGNKTELEISAIAMETKQLKISADSVHLLTKLSASKNYAINEVSIYGQKIDSKKYTGSPATITSREIVQRPVTSVINALSGTVSGIQISSGGGQPGSSPDIQIRGRGSLNMNNAPMIILDGAPYSGNLTSINPADIDNIIILKDASATAIYGSRSINNVIMITTKSGKAFKAEKVNLFQRIKNIFQKKTKLSTSTMPSLQQDVISQSEAVPDETYESFVENPFENPDMNPLSTFSIDVDNAAYTNIRRLINNGQVVPKDAVRIEEMINFFHYQYPQPKDEHPFSINTEYSVAPWNTKHKLLRIGLQGKIIPTEKLPASNLVFLIDVSGSMDAANKLPLLKSSMKLLVGQLRKEDKVTIVVYAGAAGLILPPTSGDRKQEILNSLEQLQAGGSTAGGQGIELAYKMAQENFIKDGNNRVILATDGDFNVGAFSDADMQTLIEQKRKSNIFLTCLGYGMGNYKDSKMEVLADKGNGNYAYIDNLQEANRFLVKEFSGTMYSIAKDVKIQIEFNPQFVQSYRLIGYENRKLKTEDFVNDIVDAGELGSGHTVTALYEIIPVGIQSEYNISQPSLKYSAAKSASKSFGDELATVKFRYKKPNGDKSIEMVKVIDYNPIAKPDVSADFKLASAVAWFGLRLRDSKLVPDKSKDSILKLAKEAIVNDNDGYKSEFVRLIEAVE